PAVGGHDAYLDSQAGDCSADLLWSEFWRFASNKLIGIAKYFPEGSTGVWALGLLWLAIRHRESCARATMPSPLLPRAICSWFVVRLPVDLERKKVEARSPAAPLF